jgi:hypothetical protein
VLNGDNLLANVIETPSKVMFAEDAMTNNKETRSPPTSTRTERHHRIPVSELKCPPGGARTIRRLIRGKRIFPPKGDPRNNSGDRCLEVHQHPEHKDYFPTVRRSKRGESIGNPRPLKDVSKI